MKDLIIKQISEEHIIVTGDTLTYKKDLKKLGGKWQKFSQGWMFPLLALNEIRHFINTDVIESESKAGSRWTEIEEKELINELDADTSLSEISKLHKRTVGGIKARVYIIIGKSDIEDKESLCALYKVEYSDYMYYCERGKIKQEEKTDSTSLYKDKLDKMIESMATIEKNEENKRVIQQAKWDSEKKEMSEKIQKLESAISQRGNKSGWFW